MKPVDETSRKSDPLISRNFWKRVFLVNSATKKKSSSVIPIYIFRMEMSVANSSLFFTVLKGSRAEMTEGADKGFVMAVPVPNFSLRVICGIKSV